MASIIICPQCLRYSAHPDDITNRWCGHCKRQTNGRAVELPDPGRVGDAERQAALYGLEVIAARALANGADQDQAVAAVRRSIRAFLDMRSQGPVPLSALLHRPEGS